MFRVGQKVVCVAPSSWSDEFIRSNGLNDVAVGEIYTVRELVVRPHGRGIRTREIVNPVHAPTGLEYAFYASRFRPVVERKTDISVFKKMLNPAPQKVLEDHRMLSLADCAGRSW